LIIKNYYCNGCEIHKFLWCPLHRKWCPQGSFFFEEIQRSIKLQGQSTKMEIVVIIIVNEFFYEAINIIFNPFTTNHLFCSITPLCMMIPKKCLNKTTLINLNLYHFIIFFTRCKYEKFVFVIRLPWCKKVNTIESMSKHYHLRKWKNSTSFHWTTIFI
jgi:hypothetical protein